MTHQEPTDDPTPGPQSEQEPGPAEAAPHDGAGTPRRGRVGRLLDLLVGKLKPPPQGRSQDPNTYPLF